MSPSGAKPKPPFSPLPTTTANTASLSAGSFGGENVLAGAKADGVAVRDHSSAAAGTPSASAGASRWKGALSFCRHRPGLALAGVFLLFLIAAALFPGLLAAGDPLEGSARLAFQAPSFSHCFGTDENGRELWTRIVYGAGPSLLLGLAATAIGLGAGIMIGLVAGLSHRAVDSALMRGIDVMLAFPHILLALVVITFWGQGTLNSILAVGIASVPRYARLVYGQVRLVRRASYVESALTLGLTPAVLVRRHVLPNAIKPVLILATIGVGETIGFGAMLSFLGLGAPPPAPEWGAMLSIGRDFLANAWWLTAIPGLAITFTVLSVTALGRELLRRSAGKTAR
jgi:peptide/nickel transport system permease protein